MPTHRRARQRCSTTTQREGRKEGSTRGKSAAWHTMQASDKRRNGNTHTGAPTPTHMFPNTCTGTEHSRTNDAAGRPRLPLPLPLPSTSTGPLVTMLITVPGAPQTPNIQRGSIQSNAAQAKRHHPLLLPSTPSTHRPLTRGCPRKAGEAHTPVVERNLLSRLNVAQCVDAN